MQIDREEMIIQGEQGEFQQRDRHGRRPQAIEERALAHFPGHISSPDSVRRSRDDEKYQHLKAAYVKETILDGGVLQLDGNRLNAV
jgi:hypothetical protein